MNRFRMITAAALATLAGLAVAGPIDPPAGPVGSTGKTLTQVEPRVIIDGTTTIGDADSQFRITSGGSYYLGGSLTVTAGRGFLEIAASNVTIDLSGFRVSGVAGSLDGIVLGPGVTNVTIKNGTIVGFGGDGVDTAGATGVRVEGVTVSGCGGTGVRAGTSGIVSGCVVTGCGGDGFNLPGGSVATGCTSKSNTGNGFFASGAASMTQCTARENTATGFYITSGASVDHCESLSNQGYGVASVSNSDLMRVTDCAVSQNAQGGIHLASGSLIKANSVFTSGGLTCISLFGNGNRVEGNTTRGTGNSVACVIGTVDNFIIGNWHYSATGTNGFAAVNAGSNVVGPIVTTQGTIATTNPWANFTR